MVERMARRFDVLLRSVVASPETPIGELAWYDAAEREQVLSTWNASEVDYRIEGGVASWLRARADAVPEATALVFGDASMSYLELDRLSEHWAVRLRAAGVGPEVIVGLGMRRGFGLVVGLLAVVKAGGAFMPLDPDYPAQRLRQMLEDADAPVLLSDAGSARMFAELAPSARVLVVEADGGPVPEGAVERLADEAGPQDLAYVIFTSGSTGRPKGAMNLQRGLANDLLWYHHRVLGFRSEDRVLQSTSISFDPSIWQILGTLAFGATLVLPPPGLERDVDALALEVGRRGITILTLVPSLLRALLAAPGFRAPVPLRYMLCGGEALDSDLAGQFLHAFPGVRLGNFYGPSEASCDSAWQEVALPLEPRAIVPIGRPTANVKLYVLDDRGRPLPCGVAGELSVGGVGVGRGYLKRPELTAERFVDDPWHAGGRLYRTGDRVRWLADGRLEFLGRLDTQVKLRGQRVELGEIEAALYACAGVREAAVVTHGQAQALALVAYVVAPGGGIDDLRAELAAGLPAYMVPAAFVALDALPRLPNGKLDRRALPEPSFEAREPDSSGPRSGVEATLLEIWRGVLSKAKTIGTRSNFFELGGDSLSATLVVSRVRSTFGVDVPLSTMFDHPTIAGLAEVLEGNWPQWSTEAMTAVDRGGPLQVSFSQRRMWLIHQLDPLGAAYNMGDSRHLRGALDVGSLRRALTALVARHEAFRTRFAFGKLEPMAWVDAPSEARLTLLDAGSDPDWSEQLQRAIAEPFDLERGPLHRFLLVRLGEAEHVFVLVMHHIVLDDWARAIVWRELAELYRAQRADEAARLPAKRYDFADYAFWQRRRLDDAALQAQAQRWIERLRGMVPLELPTDRKRGMRETSAGSSLRAEVGVAWMDRVKRFSSSHGVTPFMTLLAAFQLLLSRWCGQDDIAVGFPVANRNHEYTEDVVGSLVNTLVMRVPVDPDATVAELLREVRAAALAAFENQDLPYDYLMDRLRAERIVEAGADLRVLFNVLNTPESEVCLDGLDTTPYRMHGRATQFDLSLHVATEVAPILGFAYSDELFSEGMVDAMLQAYLQLVEQIVEHPNAALRTLATTTPADLEHLRQWNATARELPAARTVHALLLEHRGDSTPALRDSQGRELSHAQLWRRVEQFARMLRARGARRGRLVGLGVERGIDMVVAQLAVLRSGAAYLPLEPAFPRQRLQDMIEDAQPILLVTTEASQATWEGMPVPLLLLDAEREALEALPSVPQEPDAECDARGEDAAYVIYTSGSTGRPKGVVVPHAAVVNFLSSMRREPGLGAADRILAVTTLSFDIAVLELLLPLAVGACAVIATREDAMDADRLRGLLDTQAITVMQATPGTWSMLVDSGWSGSPGFRALVGGESLSPELAAALLGRCGEVWNMYGPTETTVWSTCWRVVPGTPVISIGRPIDNTQVYVLDPQGQPCAVGVSGEIWIGGAGVASGYFARPELTAERFVSDPWSEGGRMYRTGDRGRWLPDGLLEHRGRLDFQVKVRGYRIELGELESRLLAHPQMRDCVVIVREDVPGDVRLVAYCVGDASADALREHMRMTLPAYMVPQHFVALDALPRLPNGKLDRRALPIPRDEAPARSGAAQDLGTPAERLMAGIWSELLGSPDVRRTDNFFDLGGHSLLANRAVVEFAARGGARIELRRLIFETLGQLVAGIELGTQGSGEAEASIGGDAPDAPARGPGSWLRRLLGR
ncbi:non-ribosomal peptide synthetase [Thiomonas sp. FB-6]|uniref:non-ribosomal peptide synthetase n=1 Tax=Thiomonas sp. FB-6 TaxID=1158291 RepID=UPI00039D1E31|nr:non-ribosomal peptide synthetase [Thiomonas sp. FB-6]